MVAPSMALLGAKAAYGSYSAVQDAYRIQANAQAQADLIQRQMDEVNIRTNYNERKIFAQGEKAVASQTAAFVKAGVSLQGSSLAVLQDTVANAGLAAYEQRRAANYQLENMAFQKGGYEFQASQSELIKNILSGVIGVGAEAGADYAKLKASSNNSRRAPTGGNAAIQQANSSSGDYLDRFSSTNTYTNGLGVDAYAMR